jgi:hypothetical protein
MIAGLLGSLVGTVLLILAPVLHVKCSLPAEGATFLGLAGFLILAGSLVHLADMETKKLYKK